MRFEIGKYYKRKYYKRTTDSMLHIVSAGLTTLYGWTFIAEQVGINAYETFLAVGQDEDSAVNYTEITEEEWLTAFTE